MSPRRSDTRQRIIEVALELFADKGYEKTALREIAERLGITKAALYYHFASKEALLAGIMESLVGPFDELVAWSEGQPRTIETRRELLRRLGELLAGEWAGRWVRFTQENQPTLRLHDELSGQMQARLAAIAMAAIDPDAGLRDQLRSLGAIGAVYIGSLPPSAAMLGALGIKATSAELAAATMEIAHELLEPSPTN
jgi:AcrR family transcriptional regulator